MDYDSLGNRMKSYELSGSSYLTKKVPVIVRLDGKAFHTFTKSFEKPFSDILADCFLSSAISLSKEMQGFKLFYTQSDELSFLLTNFDKPTTEAWFDYNVSKINSIAASTFYTMSTYPSLV